MTEMKKKNLLSRRAVLKAGLAGAFALAVYPLTGARAANGGQVLTVFYSRSGNTRALAALMQALAGGDIAELETVHPYPAEYRATTEQAKRELAEGFMPPLKTRFENLAQYDAIIVGSPCWWSTVAPPVMTFLSGHDLSGKTIAPFMTHEGSGLGHTVADLKRLCPNSNVTEGLAVRGSRAAEARNEAAEWLARIGLVK